MARPSPEDDQKEGRPGGKGQRACSPFLPPLIKRRSSSLPDLKAEIALNPEAHWDKLLRFPPISTIYSSIAMNASLAKKLTPRRGKEKPIPEALPMRVSVFKETNKRTPPIPINYDFPGWCYGCRYCPGCPQWKKPHLHRDKPVRTGGGFTYMRRQIPNRASMFLTDQNSTGMGFIDRLLNTKDGIIPLPDWALKKMSEFSFVRPSSARMPTETDIPVLPAITGDKIKVKPDADNQMRFGVAKDIRKRKMNVAQPPTSNPVSRGDLEKLVKNMNYFPKNRGAHHRKFGGSWRPKVRKDEEKVLEMEEEPEEKPIDGPPAVAGSDPEGKAESDPKAEEEGGKSGEPESGTEKDAPSPGEKKTEAEDLMVADRYLERPTLFSYYSESEEEEEVEVKDDAAKDTEAGAKSAGGSQEGKRPEPDKTSSHSSRKKPSLHSDTTLPDINQAPRKPVPQTYKAPVRPTPEPVLLLRRQSSTAKLPATPMRKERSSISRQNSSIYERQTTTVSEVSSQSELSFVIASQPSSPELPPIVEEKKEEEIEKPVEKEESIMTPKRMQRRKLAALQKRQPSQKAAPRVRRPVMKEDLREKQDPLDYLSKYCIIHPNRLPAYEVVFRRTIALQQCRYPDNKKLVDLQVAFFEGDREDTPPLDANLTAEEQEDLRATMVAEKSTYAEVPGKNEGERHLAKADFLIAQLKEKQEVLKKSISEGHANITTMVAALIRKEFASEYLTSCKQRHRKGKTFTREDLQLATDKDLLRGLDPKLYRTLLGLPSVKRQQLTSKRQEKKLGEAAGRLRAAEEEREKFRALGEDLFSQEIVQARKPAELKRQQSLIFNKMHPDQDMEMNVEDLEGALQSLNNNLLTQKECEYVYHILNLPSRPRINMQLFSCIAALSEKISHMEPVVRKLINKFDFEALQWKLLKSKELFYLLDDQDIHTPKGTVSVNSLIVELMAGGLAADNIKSVMTKFDREMKGFVEFLDYLTYVPLFVEIHQRIIEDPFSEEKW